MEGNELIVRDEIKNKIYTIRGLQVMIDSDLAELYEVKTKNLNKAVKRNIEKFPKDFMFQLTEDESENLKFQFGMSSDDSLRFQNGTLKKMRGKHRKYLPYVFTEQGIATLSGVLKSKRAIEVNIQIMRAFVAMRKFLLTNAQLFQRIDRTEQKLLEHDDKFSQVFSLIEDRSIKPSKGIFFEGQMFDAYTFISDLIRSAEKSIILIDNFVDDSVLTLFSKGEGDITVKIYTKEISKQLSLDLKKYNSQYPSISIEEFKNSHDRFMIIDDKEVYHIGASLKDLGKKWFAFSKFDKEAAGMLEKLS